MKHYGGPKSSPTYTGQLLNKNHGINPARVDANAASYRKAGEDLFQEALEIIKSWGSLP
jgi:hypothetical protein